MIVVSNIKLGKYLLRTLLVDPLSSLSKHQASQFIKMSSFIRIKIAMPT